MFGGARDKLKDSKARHHRVLWATGRSLDCILVRKNWKVLSRVT